MADLKQTAVKLFHSTLAAIDIPATMERKLARRGAKMHVAGAKVDLSGINEVVVIAFGKAGYAMVEGARRVLEPDYRCEGILSVPAPPPKQPQGFQVFLAGHPVPNPASLAAGEAILARLSKCTENTLVLFLLSGGGSALVEKPLFDGVTLADVQALNRTLVTCGAPIDEINAVRKHFSAIKGGRLAAAAAASLKITLGVSDVPEGRESALASGPTIPDPTTVADALHVVEQYKLRDKLPAALRAHLDELPETPKPGDPAFARNHFQLLLGLQDLFEPAKRLAEQAGFVAVTDNSTDDWPLAKAADALLARLVQLKNENPSKPVAVIADGEVSSPVTGDGTGGRNSALVLDCVEKIAARRIAVASAGTDGVDGNSPSAGAAADGDTLDRARKAGLDPGDYFQRSDAYSFFSKLGDAIETGPTGNNLRDLRIFLAE